MLFFSLNIIGWLEQHQLPCIFKKLTHFDCPGCGFQRSFVALLQGNMVESFKIYPALLPILLLFCLLAVRLITKNESYNTALKYLFLFCASIIVVSYIYKILTL